MMMRSIKAFIKMTVESSQALEIRVNVTEADAQIFGGKSANKNANIIIINGYVWFLHQRLKCTRLFKTDEFKVALRLDTMGAFYYITIYI